MSFSFHLACDADAFARTPSVNAIVADLYPGVLYVAEADDVDLDGDWPETYLHFHVDGMSARSVEVGRSSEGFDVRVMTCSNRVDHELALELVQRLARALHVMVTPEDSDEALSLEQLRLTHGRDWVEAELVAGPRLIIAMVDRDPSEVLTIPGAVRPYHLGPEHLARLRSRGPTEELPLRLLEDIRRVQYLEDECLFVANVLHVRKGDDDEGYTTAVIGPGVNYLLPDVQWFSIAGTGGLRIPARELDALWPDVLEKVDEKQVVLRTLDDDAWAAFIARAAAASVPSARAVGAAKPWWKFWS